MGNAKAIEILFPMAASSSPSLPPRACVGLLVSCLPLGELTSSALFMLRPVPTLKASLACVLSAWTLRLRSSQERAFPHSGQELSGAFL